MKKLIALLTIAGMMTFGVNNIILAQDTPEQPTEQTVDQPAVQEAAAEDNSVEMVAEPEENLTFHETLKEQFIDRGPEFMGIVLLTLIFGLAIVIERII